MTYNVLSPKAEEFINNEEIEATLAYAATNKSNRELIRGIIDKAKAYKGLTHREAMVLFLFYYPEY